MATAPRQFGVQFQEAIDYLKGKLPEASLAWNDLAGPVHGKVFTVAGATSADLARDLQQALVQALAEGQTITSFRKNFDQVVQARGWTYRGKRGWRTAVIFNTNMRSATMAGRWAQIQAAKADRPYLQYRTAGDARVRPQHRIWNGLIYPVDHSFWSTHYPPNGWGCRCTVRSYSLGDLRSRGLQVSEPARIQTRAVVNADGEITDQVPIGIDPGWDHNVGQSWIAPELSLGAKLARLPLELRGPMVDKTISPAFQTVLSGNWASFQSAVKANSAPAGTTQVLGFLDSATLDGLARVAPTLELDSTAVVALDRSVASLAQTWPQDLVDQLPSALRDYQAVLWDRLHQHLVVIPAGALPGTDAKPQIELLPNQQTKQGQAITVQYLSSAPLSTLLDATRYQLLVGRLR